MTKAAELQKQIQSLGIEKGFSLIEKANEQALHFDVINEDTMCIMHDDGSVNMIELGGGGIVSSVISAENILKVLNHYKPFKEVFKNNIN